MNDNSLIDPRSIIDPGAKLGENVSIGPWTIIGPDVEIGVGSIIASHVVIKGPTVIGRDNKIFQFSTIGDDSPDLKYHGEPTRLVIGDNNIIREGVTIHRGTIQDRSETTIGSDNLIMAYVHIGHDSIIGDHCIFANNAALAGHVSVGDWVNLGGYTLIHQYCHIGSYSFTGMGSVIGKDVPAYVTVNGNPVAAKSINAEGLKRRGYSSESIATIRKAYKVIYRQGLTIEDALVILKEMKKECADIGLLVESLESSNRGIVR